jgi:signal peptidase I
MSESQELKSKGRRKRPESNSILAKMLRKAKRNPVAAFAIDILTIVGAALILSLLIKTFLIRSFFIPSGSMMNTLQIDDRIIVNELVPDLIPLTRGDVVVFTDPGGWLYTTPTETPTNGFVAAGEWFLSIFGLTAPDSSQHLVKRVIGVGGDHVVCCDAKGKLQINGKSITEPYVIDGANPSDLKFDVVVPANSFWVMGDNRSNSEDSRYHRTLPGKGFVPKDAVVGRAFALSWPFNRWSWLDNYPNVFKDVPNN